MKSSDGRKLWSLAMLHWAHQDIYPGSKCLWWSTWKCPGGKVLGKQSKVVKIKICYFILILFCRLTHYSTVICTERDKSAPPFGRHRLGAHRLGDGTNGRRRFGAGRYGAGQQTQVKLPLNKNEWQSDQYYKFVDTNENKIVKSM